MNEDTLLLHDFVKSHSEEAFTTLVQHHLPMVHATALRRVGGDAHLAQDVAQTVFISLARKASSLRDLGSLAGWLYVSTHRATAEVVRREQRRKQHEQAAHSMNLTNAPQDLPVDPASLRHLLDDALMELKSDDREAVILRFFAQHSFAEIGATLRITEEAARKRVDRALEKLHRTLSRRGIVSSVAALGTTMTAAGITTTPATLVSQIAGVAFAQSMALPAATLTSVLTTSFLPAAASAAMLAGLWTIMPQHRANAAMVNEIAHMENAPQAGSDVQSDIDKLSRALALARTPPVIAVQTPTSTPLSSAASASVASARIAGAKEVTVDPEGRLKWEGVPVTLDDFLVHLLDYQSTSKGERSQIIIKANGAQIPQVYYVLVEARKAGITSLVLESDSEPQVDGPFPTVWF